MGGVAGLGGYWASTKVTGTTFQWDQALIATGAGAISGAACTGGVIAGCLAVSASVSVIQYGLSPGPKTATGYIASAAFGVLAGRFTFTKTLGLRLSSFGYFAGEHLWLERGKSAAAGFIRSLAISVLADVTTNYAGPDICLRSRFRNGTRVREWRHRQVMRVEDQ